MSHPVDRVVLSHPRGGWEVRAPGATRPSLHSHDRAEALQWAWNITRSTGGKIIVHRGDAPGR